MKNLLLIIALLLSACSTQTILQFDDKIFKYEAETTFTVQFYPNGSAEGMVYLSERKFEVEYTNGIPCLKIVAIGPGAYVARQYSQDGEVVGLWFKNLRE